MILAPSDLQVRLGEHNLESDFDGAAPLDFAVSRTLVHPNYSTTRFHNDIAIITLQSEVSFLIRMNELSGLPTYCSTSVAAPDRVIKVSFLVRNNSTCEPRKRGLSQL